MYRIYLAGPDVFARDPLILAARKKAICAKYGFEGVFPLDNELDLTDLKPFEKGLRISAANEELMRTCDLVIANMTPFRGPNTDSGTAYEMGFMRALGKPVLGYANVYNAPTGEAGFPHIERVKTYYGHLLLRDETEEAEDPIHHMLVEDFDMVDNLMLDGAVYFSGGEVVVTEVDERDRYENLDGFEQCVIQAAQLMAAPKVKKA
jgi:nucleoside 2-deoxyribosyltransferase